MEDEVAQRIDHDAQTRLGKVCLDFQQFLFIGRNTEYRLVGGQTPKLRYHRGIEHIARTLGKSCDEHRMRTSLQPLHTVRVENRGKFLLCTEDVI